MITDWNRRYQQQAHWTQDLRSYLYKQVNVQAGQRVLDLGSGTGVLSQEFQDQGLVGFGLDIDPDALAFARDHNPGSFLSRGDAYQLPYADHTFDLTLCHFVLMWLTETSKAVAEMVRVTKIGGKVLAFAEPDYGGRIDFPDELTVLGQHQIKSLVHQGADPNIGRKLAGIFHSAGLRQINSGILGGQWSIEKDCETWESEWQVFEADMNKLPGHNLDLAALKETERSARLSGLRVLFVPTFFAWGNVQ